MDVVVDTNVPVTANGKATKASTKCMENCIGLIGDILRSKYILRLDDDWHILGEYEDNMRSEGQPGVGDRFLLWTLRNRSNPARCRLVRITTQDIYGQSPFVEFPTDSALAGFDPDDHKFVAVALANQAESRILNATDRDWWEYRRPLEANSIQIEFLCPDAMTGP